MHCRIRYLLALLVFPFLASLGQKGEPVFENISTRHGQLHTLIEHILQDSLGFLWFATQEGLFRYDGYAFTGFRHDVFDSTSVSAPHIEHIIEGPGGEIWASNNGINLLDRRRGTFRRFLTHEHSVKQLNLIRRMHLDQQGRMWLAGHRNVLRFDPVSGTSVMLTDAGRPERGHFVYAFTESPEGVVWCATRNGLLRLTSDTTFVHVDLTATHPGWTQVLDLAYGYDGSLWLAGPAGLGNYDPETGSLTFPVLPEPWAQHPVETMHMARDGRVLLALRDQGLGIYHPQHGTLTVHQQDPEVTGALQNNEILCIYEDREDNIWLGTTSGIARLSYNDSGYRLLQNTPGVDQPANFVTRVLRARDGTLWTITADGLYRKVPGAVRGQRVVLLPGDPEITFGYWLFEDSYGTIWVPVNGYGLLRKRAQDDVFKPFTADARLAAGEVDKIVEDPADPHLLWIGTSRGLCALNTATNDTEWFIPREQISGLTTNRTTIFEQYGHDEIWLYYTYFTSLGRFTKSTGTFEIFQPPAELQYTLQGAIKDIAIGDDGLIWIANQYGMTVFDTKTHTYRLYTHRDGLLHDPLNAVLIAQDQRVWVSGHQFFGVRDPDTDRFTSQDVGHLIKAFWSKGRYIDHTGRLYFSGLNGVFTFHPDSIRQDTSSPQVVLVDFLVKDSTYRLNRPFEFVEEIVLSHDQNDLSFSFAGISLRDPDRLTYRCRLDGYDVRWRNLERERTVNYGNLDDGTYVFRAQAANGDGVWSERELAIRLMITPHFTDTGWFRALIGLLLVALAYAGFRIRQHQLELKRQKEVAEQAADFRLRFLTNVSHEIRTPMNAIIGMSGLAREGAESPEQTRYLSAIEHASKNLLAIVNELLDHAKITAGRFQLDHVPFSLHEQLNQLQAVMSALVEEKPVRLKFTIADDVPDRLSGDPLRLTQILTNLLGNAIKYTDEGKIHLEVALSERQQDTVRLQFTVTDTGVGMSRETLEHVFEPFLVRPGRDPDRASTGLGLHITRQLVELQGGTIAVQSEVGRGTVVSVALPYVVTDTAVAQAAPSAADPTRLDALCVLLVDDAPFNHMVLSEMLKKRVTTLDIKTATDGAEAVALAQQHPFDLIIMDAKMPGMDGLEATRQIRALPSDAASTPILGATAGAMPEQIDACLESGMNDVITKPVMIDELIRKIRQLTQTVAQ